MDYIYGLGNEPIPMLLNAAGVGLAHIARLTDRYALVISTPTFVSLTHWRIIPQAFAGGLVLVVV